MIEGNENRILIGGPQGSGKSTQGKLLAKVLEIPYVSTGDISRELAEQDSKEGKRVKQLLAQGKFTPDDVIAKYVKDRLDQTDCSLGFVMDGYPRSLDQLKYFDPQYNKVFYLDVPDDVVVGRLVKRGREDDTQDLIQERLKIYHRLTEPVLNFYQDQGILCRIDGVATIEKIQEEIRGYIKNG